MSRTFNPDDVYNMASRILTTLNTASAAVSGVKPLPTRQVVSTGGAVYDCGMVSVSAISTQMGFPEAQGSTSGSNFTDGSYTFPFANISLWTCKYEVAIVRCAEERYDGRALPKVEWIQNDLRAASLDAATLIELTERMVQSLGAPAPAGAVDFLQPAGELIATRMQITVPLWPDVYV